MKEEISIQGIVRFDVYDENGRHTRMIEKNNLVTSAGKNYFVKKIIEDPSIIGSAIAEIAVGDGSTAPTVSDTDLESETGRVNIDTISATNNIGEFVTQLPIGVATGTIQEAGLYTSDSTPILISRIVLSSPVTKGAGETITISWRFKIGSDS
jgi:sporulation protein YlmC with PRC-barrel domain